jgi:hypothetical protein
MVYGAKSRQCLPVSVSRAMSSCDNRRGGKYTFSRSRKQLRTALLPVYYRRALASAIEY